MAKLNEQLKALFNEWQDDICKEIDRIKMEKLAKVDEILAPKSKFHKNKDKLTAIKAWARTFASEALNITKKANNTFDYATYIVNMMDENADENDDEDEKPAAYCDHCGRAIWDEDDIVCGYEGEYCCDECREENEDENEDDCLDEDDDDDEDEEPLTWCDNCGKMIWSENKFVDGLGGEYCCEECKVQGQREK